MRRRNRRSNQRKDQNPKKSNGSESSTPNSTQNSGSNQHRRLNQQNHSNNQQNKLLKKIKVLSTNISKDEKRVKENSGSKNNFNNRRDENRRNNRKTHQRDEVNNSKNNPGQKRPFIRTIIPYKINMIPKAVCQKCEKLIEDMTSAIFDQKENKYYHFDCILKEIKKNREIKPTQRYVYLGSNTFAIIEDVKKNGKMTFVIKEKFQYLTKPAN